MCVCLSACTDIAYQNIFQFHIPMDQSLTVKVTKSFDNINRHLKTENETDDQSMLAYRSCVSTNRYWRTVMVCLPIDTGVPQWCVYQ